MAWWSLLGLLSSSCCVLQIILNALSFGCAGFNTVLGPVRPPCIAFTLIAQSLSWYVAFPRPFQWAPTAATTAVSMLLTFSPELLYLTTQRRLSEASSQRKSGTGTVNGTMCLRLAFAPKAMGCISCVSKVDRVLRSSPVVAHCAVSLQSASAMVLLVPESAQNGVTAADRADHVAHEKIAQGLVDEINAAGFPASLVSISPTTPADIAELERPGNTESNAAAGGPSPLTAGRDLPATTATVQARRGGTCAWGGLQAWSQCVVGGLLGSSCCLLQLGANLLASLNIVHIGCTGFNKVLGPIRPQIRLITGAYMGVYFVWTLSRPGTRTHRQLTRLIVTSVIFVGLTFLPELLLWSGVPAVAPPTANTHSVRLKIHGMGCEACQTHVKGLLDRAGGVVSSSVDFRTGDAEVLVASGWGRFDVSHVAGQLDRDGYMLDLVSGGEDALAGSTHSAATPSFGSVTETRGPEL